MTTAFMQGPKGCTGLTHDGVTYPADQDGVVEVPAEVIDAGFSRGFALMSAKVRPKVSLTNTKP